MLKSRTIPFALAAFVAFLPQARADNASCVNAYENGQIARRDRDLVKAQTELSRCAQSDCPEIIRNDCGEWLREVERAIPTLIVSARWANGSDIVDARVTIDDKPVAEQLDGKPFAVNPGEHRVRVESESASASQVVVAIQGEHDRVLRFELKRPAPKAETARAEPARKSNSISEPGPGPMPFVLAGVSALAFAGFGYYALSGRSDLRELRDTCAPNCSQNQLDDVKRKLLVADILLGVGLVSAASATYLFVSSGRNPQTEQHEARVTLVGRF